MIYTEFPAPPAERRTWHPVVWPENNIDPVKETRQSNLVVTSFY